MKLTRSFFSIYLIIIFTFIGFTYLLDEAWRYYLKQDIESYTGYKVMLHAVGDYLENHPEDDWQHILSEASKKYQLPLGMMNYGDMRDHFARSDRKSLKKGNTFVAYNDDDVQLYHLLSDKKTLLTLGPAKMPTRPRMEALMRMAILAALGLLILCWLWPMSKDLDQLRKATQVLGKGDFDVKVPKARSVMMGTMVKAFNMMTARVKRLIDAHKELSNAVAHELRTPLARSKFALQMLESVDETKQARYRQQIAGDIYQLEELINEMLLYASFDSDKPTLDLKETDMESLVAEQVGLMSHYQGEITVDNQLNDNLIACDRHFIARALTNFMTNAQKYGNDKIHITLSADRDYCQISVEDNGDGICDELQPILFDAFSRGDVSRNKETGGFGLGLAIVSRIMEWHEGEASAGESQFGGAKFTIRWPNNLSLS